MYAIASASLDVTRVTVIVWGVNFCDALRNPHRINREMMEIPMRMELPIFVWAKLRTARIRKRGEYELKNNSSLVEILATREEQPPSPDGSR